MGRRSSVASAMIASSFLSPSRPCAAAMPSSAKCARKALIAWVRWRISRSRARCSINWLLALLLGRLDAHKAHGWTPDRLADRLGVGCVVLIALEIGLHVLRRHQTNLVSELGQLASPIVGCGTGLHPDQAWRQRCEERDHLAAPQLLSDNDLLSCIDAMNLEYVLGDIQTHRGNLHVDGSLGDSLATITLWQFVAGSGRRPPHQKPKNSS